MKRKTMYQIASLIMALVMIGGNVMHTQATALATVSPSIYWGALVNAAPSSINMAPGGPIDQFETLSKKKMAIIHWGQPWMMSDGSWGEFQTTYFDNVRNHGSIPMINWSSHRLGNGVNDANWQLSDVYAGTYDTYIRRWATAAKSWGHPFFLYFDPEMNGWWYSWGEGKTSTGVIVNGNSTGDFVKAWRHVHDIFTSVGATNVSWVWGPNIMSTSTQYPPLAGLYPGDGYVDWTSLSVFNRYSTWLGLNSLVTASGGITWLKNSYNQVLTVAPTKPMMMAQWGSIEAGDGGAKKAAWLTDALTTQIPINFPKIKAVVYFNWQDPPTDNYPIQSSQASINAWATGIGSALYAANQYAGLNTSPIPPLATLTSTSATLIAVADSYINSAYPASTAGGTSTTLRVDSSPVQTTFLKFDLTPLAGKTISTVALKFKTTTSPGGSTNSASVRLVYNVQWKEQYLSYSNSVPVSATVLGTVPANTAPSTWYAITLTPSVIQQYVGGLLSVAITATGTDELLLNSRESTDKPQLVITYK